MEIDYVWKKSGVTTQGRKEVEAGTLLLGNDKNNVTANKLLSCFQCFSFQWKWLYKGLSRGKDK